MLTLLDRYFLKGLLDYWLLGIVVFTLVLLFSDALLDFMKDLQHYGISWDIALTLVGLQVPRIIALVIPMSSLLAVLSIYNNMNNHFELVALRMLGISLSRLARPALMLGLLGMVLTYLLHDYVVPQCNKYSRALKNYAVNQQNLPATQENFTYKQFDDKQQLKRLLYISQFQKNRLGYSTVVDLTNPETLQIIQARSGLWESENIHLENANVYTVTLNQKLSNTTHADHLTLQHFLRPEVVVSQYKPSEQSFWELFHWIQQESRHGKTFSPTVYVTLWEKLVLPISTIPLVLIGVPLAISAPRRLGNLGFPIAIAVIFLYYVLRHVSAQLGGNSLVPPFMAAILPFCLMTLLMIFLFRLKERVL